MAYRLKILILSCTLYSMPLHAQKAEQSLEPDDFAFIERLFQSYGPDTPSASVCVIKGSELVFAKSYGLSNINEGISATIETNYRLASLTKQVTAMAVMILKSRGQLDYEDPMTLHLPSFPAYGQKVKIRHLLNHTSGLYDYEDYIPSGQTQQLTDEDVVQILSERRNTRFTPGSRYSYSNSGYGTLAVIVSRVSGLSFSDFLEQNIFIPLEMDQTVAYVQGTHEIFNRALGYTYSGGTYRLTDQSITSAVLGDGGVYTSIVDYFKWDQALYTDRLLPLALLEEAFTMGQTNDGQNIGYGFGWKIDSYRGEKRLSHTGSTIGFRSAVQRFPDKELTVFVIINKANTAPWDQASQIASRLLE